MQPHTTADITGDGTAKTLSSITGITSCKWFQVSAISVAGTPARCGDSSILIGTSSPYVAGIGIPINAGGGQFAPPIALGTEFYDLTKWYVIGAIGDLLSVAVAS